MQTYILVGETNKKERGRKGKEKRHKRKENQNCRC